MEVAGILLREGFIALNKVPVLGQLGSPVHQSGGTMIKNMVLEGKSLF